jgi:hypothetical protein
MKNVLKASLYSAVALGAYSQSVLQNYAAAPTDTFGTTKATTTATQLEDQTLPEAIQTYVNYIMTFLYLIAVMYAIWGGFLILTAGGDEEKVKKGKTILIQGAIGLFVVFIAATLVRFILGVLAA